MLSVAMGEEVPPGVRTDDRPGARARAAAAGTRDGPRGFRAIVVGAGVSGLAASIRLAEAGIPHVVLERNDTVGGTWLENRYPGAGVDTPSALYSFSFAQRDWTQYFALRDELHGYLGGLADEYGVRGGSASDTRCCGASYDEAAQEWEVVARPAARPLRANILITAVGGFNKPKWPALQAWSASRGRACTPRAGPTTSTLAGKRVGVIGNGASAMQLVPAVCEEAASITVFQRSPQWAAPFDQFHEEVPEAARWLAADVPLYRTWYRLRSGWTFNDRRPSGAPEGPGVGAPGALGQRDQRRPPRVLRALHRVRARRPHRSCVEKVMPNYPPFGKRILLDNGWYAALKRDDV